MTKKARDRRYQARDKKRICRYMKDLRQRNLYLLLYDAIITMKTKGISDRMILFKLRHYPFPTFFINEITNLFKKYKCSSTSQYHSST